MQTRALDSWAILEWMSGRQPAGDLVERLLTEAEQGQVRLLMSAINVGRGLLFPPETSQRSARRIVA